ncbi:hypothetical protein BOX15_Mlig031723g4, partial [Macrostomum lignano]
TAIMELEQQQQQQDLQVSGLRSARTNPAYLVSNATSHLWVFSAIAELVDNAYDPDCAAAHLDIRHEVMRGIDVLSFTDDGRGMELNRLHNMLSFGYCDKVPVKGHKPIGHYGNGFKSGSMRIGKDAIVFTKTRLANNAVVKSVGLLSQTFLARIGADTIVLPICSWVNDQLAETYPDGAQSLSLITHHCDLFGGFESEVLAQFDRIGKHGTRILIYNLKRTSPDDPSSALELDLVSDRSDIVNSETLQSDAALPAVQRMQLLQTSVSPLIRRSLKAYLSILFMKPRLIIRINNHKVRTQLMQRCLAKRAIDYYSPKLSPSDETRLKLRSNSNYRVRVVIGVLPANHSDYGAMLYHNNRLILPYEKLVKEPELASGVALIAEVDHLEPNHIKQEFIRDANFRNCFLNLTQKLKEYLELHRCSDSAAASSAAAAPPPPSYWRWVQCDSCQKWRRLLDVSDEEFRSIEKRAWYCSMNPDAYYNRCDIAEEVEDEESMVQDYRDARTTARRRNEAAAIRSLLSNSRPAGQSAASHSAESSSKRARFDPPSATSAAVSSSTASHQLGGRHQPSRQEVRERSSNINSCSGGSGGGNVAMSSTQVEQSVVSATAESSTAAVSVDPAAVKREGAVSAARFDRVKDQLRSLRCSVIRLLGHISSDWSTDSDGGRGGPVKVPEFPDQSVDQLLARVVQDLDRQKKQAQQQPRDDGQKQPGASSSNVAAVSDAQEANLSDGEIDIKPIVIDDD